MLQGIRLARQIVCSHCFAVVCAAASSRPQHLFNQSHVNISIDKDTRTIVAVTLGSCHTGSAILRM
jgi:hypothetical protein